MRAHRLLEKAYNAMRCELEELACNLADRPDASIGTVIAEIERTDLDYVPRSHLQDA